MATTATQYSRTQQRIQNGLLQVGQAPLVPGSFGYNPLRQVWIQSNRLRSHGRLTQPASNQCRLCFHVEEQTPRPRSPTKCLMRGHRRTCKSHGTFGQIEDVTVPVKNRLLRSKRPGHPTCIEPFSEGTHSFPADGRRTSTSPARCYALPRAAYRSSPAFKFSAILSLLVAASSQQDTELQLRVFFETTP